MTPQEIVNGCETRGDLAREYAKLLATETMDSYPWTQLNELIVDRWSLSALMYVKRKAWEVQSG